MTKKSEEAHSRYVFNKYIYVPCLMLECCPFKFFKIEEKKKRDHKYSAFVISLFVKISKDLCCFETKNKFISLV